MDDGRYSWETAVLNAFTATPDAAASQIDLATRAIAERLNDPHVPDFRETSVLMYALEALDTLSALLLLMDPSTEIDAGGLTGPEIPRQ